MPFYFFKKSNTIKLISLKSRDDYRKSKILGEKSLGKQDSDSIKGVSYEQKDFGGG